MLNEILDFWLGFHINDLWPTKVWKIWYHKEEYVRLMFQQPYWDHRDTPMMLFEVFDHFLGDLLEEGEVHSPKLLIFVLILDPMLQPGRLQFREIVLWRNIFYFIFLSLLSISCARKFKYKKIFFKKSPGQKTRQMKWINFTEFFFGYFPFSESKILIFYGKYSKKNFVKLSR